VCESADAIIGDIVENKYESNFDEAMDYTEDEVENNSGFPKVSIVSYKNLDTNKSVFSQVMQTSCNEITNDLHQNIHKENLEYLKTFSEAEILESRKEILSSLNPDLLSFLKSRKKEPVVASQKEPTPSSSFPVKEMESLNFLNQPESASWLNMNIFEPEKLEWTKNINDVVDNLKPGESYEARFDWKGYLMPYAFDDNDSQKFKTELYLHNTQNRPGYALQELFRLARSTILEQRIAALGSISGILDMYNCGYYDNIIDLPLSKIFFFLRFALDENTQSLIEITSKALGNLFYNESDEIFLDFIHETNRGYVQPLLGKMRNNSENLFSLDDENADEIASSAKYNVTLDRDDVEDKEERNEESMKDFHLAEIDMMSCLMRTNIVERISYIVVILKSTPTTIESCMKILIRIARSSQSAAEKILLKSNLITFLVNNYLSKFENSSVYIMKLFRIILSYNRNYAKLLLERNVLDIILNMLSAQNEITMNLIKLQIEALRFLRIYLQNHFDLSFYNNLSVHLNNLLRWHYNFLVFEQSDHRVLHAHASALMYIIRFTDATSLRILNESLNICCCKWFYMAQTYGAPELSQKILLSSILEMLMNKNIEAEFLRNFIDNYLMKFLKSDHFRSIQQSITSSLLFQRVKDRSFVCEALVNLGSVIQFNGKKQPALIYGKDNSIILLNSLLRFIKSLYIEGGTNSCYKRLSTIIVSDDMYQYLKSFAALRSKPMLCTNWFMRQEIEFIFNLLKCANSSEIVLKASCNLLKCLTIDSASIALFFFENVIFNSQFYQNATSIDELNRWKFLYNGVIISKINAKVRCFLF
jgi:hypothetical protein